MTLYGVKAGNTVVLTADGTGKKIVETSAPTAPSGYKTTYGWSESSDAITQIWELVPLEGTAEEAALALSKWQAKSLPDDYALQVPALFDRWIAGESYVAGDRIRYQGTLYKVLQGHVSQADWTPDAAPSLYAKVLPGQEGNEPEEGYGEWVQPDSTNGYALGDRVSHNGKIWESTFDGANVWEPGAVGTEALWKDVTDEVSSDDQGGVEE